MQVLVAEPAAPIANALKKFLQGTASVQVVQYVDEAVQVVRARPPDVLICAVTANFDGEVLCQQVKKMGGGTSVVLVYPPDEGEQAPRRSQEAGADAFLVGPLKRFNVLSVTRAAAALQGLDLRARVAEAEVKVLEQALADRQQALEQAERRASAQPPRAAAGLNTSDEVFFKKFMLIEVKRCRRYHYPVAVLLVAHDQLAEHLKTDPSPEARRSAIRGEAQVLIGELLRDVDLAMPFGEDKYLVFLPHTNRAGSLVVARRLVERLRRLSAWLHGTASIGVASFDPKPDTKPQISFGTLVREASERLRKAQAEGGDRFEGPEEEEPVRPRRNRISMG